MNKLMLKFISFKDYISQADAMITLLNFCLYNLNRKILNLIFFKNEGWLHLSGYQNY